MKNIPKSISEYFSKIGTKGGKSLAKQRGPDFYRENQKKGVATKLRNKAKKLSP